MKPYVMTTGVLFSLLTVAHIWRMFVETHLATDPSYLAITAIAAGLALWSWRVLRSAPRA